MSIGSLFDVNKQLTFYGAYHSHRINVLIHIICVPLILWNFQLLGTLVPMPSFVPEYHHTFNEYLAFDFNISAIYTGLCLVYYLILEPLAAVLYAPQLALSLLTATAWSRQAGHIQKATFVHVLCWVAQFVGHGVAEKRAPALLDNLLGALVLAPFFVHMELLFKAGYKPELHKRLMNNIGKEITKIRKNEGEKRRAAEAKKEL